MTFLSDEGSQFNGILETRITKKKYNNNNNNNIMMQRCKAL